MLISNPHPQKFFTAHFCVVNDSQSQGAAPISALLAQTVLCNPVEAKAKQLLEQKPRWEIYPYS